MKKTTLLQSDLSYIIATLGHMDTLVIADAGLPIPSGTLRIDLALTQGVPGAVQTLKVVLDEMKVEKVILAEEVKDKNPKFLANVQNENSRCSGCGAYRRICSLCQCDFGSGSCFLNRVALRRLSRTSSNPFQKPSQGFFTKTNY
jgi:D-ribose pyranose/furanose isomerase RbsD